jgi:uncharacterized protein
MKKAGKKPSKKTLSKPLRPLKKLIKRIKSKISKKPPKKSAKKRAVKAVFSLETVKYLQPSQILTLSPCQSPEAQLGTTYELPVAYHENTLVLLVRDPWWLYAYWEVTADRENEIKAEIQRRRLTPDRTVLRVYDITEAAEGKESSFFDIELNFFAMNWYIDVGVPHRDWYAEIGIRTADGSFFAFIKSNAVRTPRFGVSDILDEEWMMPEELYWKIYGSGVNALGQSKSSLDARMIVEKYLKDRVQGGESSFTGITAAQKK